MKEDLLANVKITKENAQEIVAQLVVENANMQRRIYDLLKENTEWKLENERLNNIIKDLDKMFEYYFLGNLKYDQDTVNTIYIKYVKLKELKGEE